MSYENFGEANPFSAREQLLKKVREQIDSKEPASFDDEVDLQAAVVFNCLDKTLEKLKDAGALMKRDKGMIFLGRLVLDAKGKPGGFIADRYSDKQRQEKEEVAVAAVKKFYEIIDEDFGLDDWVEEVKRVREKESSLSDVEIDKIVQEYKQMKQETEAAGSDVFWRTSVKDLARFTLGQSTKDGTSPGEIVPEYNKLLPEDFAMILLRVMRSK